MNWISLRYPALSDITGVVLTVVVRGHPMVVTRDITILHLDEIRVRAVIWEDITGKTT